MNPPSEVSWEDNEPGLPDAMAQVRRVSRRGMRRWWLALIAPLLMAAFSALKTYLRETAHVATVLISIPKTGAFGRDITKFLRKSMSPGQAQRTGYAEAALYVNSIVFSDDNLLAIMGRHPEYEELLRKGPKEAIEGLRGSFVVKQSAVEFIGEVTEEIEDQLGTHMMIQCSSSSYTKLMLRLCTDLASLVLTIDSEEQFAQLAKFMGSNDFFLMASRKGITDTQKLIVDKTIQLAELRQDVDLTEIAPRTREEAQLYLDITHLTTKLSDQIHEMLAISNRQRRESADSLIRESYVRADVPDPSANLLLVDAGRVGPPDMGDLLTTTLLGAIVPFLLVLPFSLLLIGAADPKVYDPEDVRLLGMRPIGMIRLETGFGSFLHSLRRHG